MVTLCRPQILPRQLVHCLGRSSGHRYEVDDLSLPWGDGVRLDGSIPAGLERRLLPYILSKALLRLVPLASSAGRTVRVCDVPILKVGFRGIIIDS